MWPVALLAFKRTRKNPERLHLLARYCTMNNNGELATMHSFWMVQRNIAKLQEVLSGTPDLRSRDILEASLKAEERKLAAIV